MFIPSHQGDTSFQRRQFLRNKLLNSLYFPQVEFRHVFVFGKFHVSFVCSVLDSCITMYARRLYCQFVCLSTGGEGEGLGYHRPGQTRTGYHSPSIPLPQGQDGCVGSMSLAFTREDFLV